MSPAREAVILARGLGTRMRARGGQLDAAASSVADTGVKALIPIERPFIDYLLHDLAEAGIARVVVVIGPEHEAMRRHCRELTTSRLEIATAVQERPLGTADEVLAAERQVAGLFLVINGDNRYPVAGLRALIGLASPGLVGFRRSGLLAGNLPSERLSRFAAIIGAPDGLLAEIMEKPDAAQWARAGADPLLSMNCWCFDGTIFTACRHIGPSPRGELELPDAVRWSIDHGTSYRIVDSDQAVLDLSSRDDIAGVRAALLGAVVRL